MMWNTAGRAIYCRVLLLLAALVASTPAAAGSDADTVQVWFAQDSLAERLIDFMDGAQVSLDYCCYNSTRDDVVDAVIAAKARSVRVRVITDNRRLGNPWVARLRQAGIPVWSDSVGPQPGDYMHNKFAVRDLANADSTDDRVWCATYNPNEGELRADCAIEMPHSGIARVFRLEFEQMWGDTGMVPDPQNAEFHDGKRDVIGEHRFQLDGHEVEVYFTPQDRPVDTVAARVRAAGSHVIFGVLAFTHDGLGDAMLDRWANDVRVGGVIDRSGIGNQGSEYPRLHGAGIPVFEDSVPFGEKMIHEKLMVIDSARTVVGSANWSRNGNEDNDEYLLVIHHPGLTMRFLDELHRRYAEAGGQGVAEPGEPHPSPRPAATVLRSVELRMRSGLTLRDATGRRVSGSDLVPGVYFACEVNGRISPVVVVR